MSLSHYIYLTCDLALQILKNPLKDGRYRQDVAALWEVLEAKFNRGRSDDKKIPVDTLKSVYKRMRLNERKEADKKRQEEQRKSFEVAKRLQQKDKRANAKFTEKAQKTGGGSLQGLEQAPSRDSQSGGSLGMLPSQGSGLATNTQALDDVMPPASMPSTSRAPHTGPVTGDHPEGQNGNGGSQEDSLDNVQLTPPPPPRKLPKRKRLTLTQIAARAARLNDEDDDEEDNDNEEEEEATSAAELPEGTETTRTARGGPSNSRVASGPRPKTKKPTPALRAQQEAELAQRLTESKVKWLVHLNKREVFQQASVLRSSRVAYSDQSYICFSMMEQVTIFAVWPLEYDEPQKGLVL